MAIIKRSMGSVKGLNDDLQVLRNELAKKLESSSVVDNLNSSDAGSALSAAQGAALKNMIDTIDGLLASDDASLDEFQEVVDFIKVTRQTLNNLQIADVDGLTEALSNKVSVTAGKGLSTNDYTDADKSIVNHFLGDHSGSEKPMIDCGVLPEPNTT